MKEKKENKSKPDHINSPSSKFQRKRKIDVLRRLDSPIIKKADSPTRRKKFNSTIKRKLISSEAIQKESYSLNCRKKKGKNV